MITGFTSVSSQDVYFSGMMRLSEDALIGQYRRLAEGVHAGGCPVVAQLALGAYYRAGVQTEPDGMTVEEIRRVEDRFIQAARRAQEAGFDGVQIHAAHFFFLSRFISPAVNHRRDESAATTPAWRESANRRNPSAACPCAWRAFACSTRSTPPRCR